MKTDNRGMKSVLRTVSSLWNYRVFSATPLLVVLIISVAHAQEQTDLAGGRNNFGAQRYELSCSTGEALVGLKGRFGSYVNSIRLKCVKITQGKWQGDIRERGFAGGEGGQPYDSTCPQNQVVSGFNGRAGIYVDYLSLQCRVLDTTRVRRTTGDRKYDNGFGNIVAGQIFGPLECPNDKPAFKAYGYSGQWIDAFGLKCQ